MSEIELAPLSDRLDEDELKNLHRVIEQAGTKWNGNEDQASQMIAARLPEQAMTEFLDRLEAHDIAADIFLPIEFDGRLQAGDYRIASAQALHDVLEEVKEELDVEDAEAYDADDEEEEEEEEEDEEEEEGTVIEAQLRNIWQLVADACQEAIDKKIPLHLRV